MKKYKITGMSCAACSARVEKAVSGVSGVTSCAVNLLTNSMVIDGNADDTAVIKAVTDAGYGATVDDGSSVKDTSDNSETASLVFRLSLSVVLLAVLIYVSMGHTMWGFPVPSFLHSNHMALGILQMILSAAVMIINGKFFISGVRGIIHRSPNMDTLVAMGSFSAFAYSVYVLFFDNGGMEVLHGLYFESAAMILTLITVGKMLESHSKGKTTDAIKSLIKLAPDTALVIGEDGEEMRVPVEKIAVGDVFVIRPGDRIPVDGEVIDGTSAVDESALTGESMPVDKAVGYTVSAATLNRTGHLRCRATRVGEDTTLARIIQTVKDAAATKAPIAKTADKVSGVFVPAVILIAALVVGVWLILGESLGFAMARGISVLVISCPCALGLATPVAIMVGSGVGARNGILYKTAAILESAGSVSTVALDKTGTVTSGEPEVTDVVPADGITEDELLGYALSLEMMSEHPLAGAIVRECERRGITADAADGFEIFPGGGVRGTLNKQQIIGGSLKYVSKVCTIPDDLEKSAKSLAGQAKTPIFFAVDDKCIGLISAADSIRKDSISAIAELKAMGIDVVMITGDDHAVAKAVGDTVGIENIIAGVMPEGKAAAVADLKKRGKVAMVGDGINDAPALTSADVGIAIGAGTDIAIDSADIVLMNSRLSDAVAAIRLSRRSLRNIRQNLFWAFAYNIIGIPLAAGAFIYLTGWEMNPMFGAAAMSLSSFIAVSNALRLNMANIHDPSHDRKIKNNSKNTKETKTMEKIMKIEGMMCPHCEARVKKTLEEIDGVETAVCSHEAGTATLTLSAEVSDDVLKNAVEAQGYKVL